jgi:hypothetical protein
MSVFCISIFSVYILHSFMVLIIERGIELYGVGRMRQVSVILDRGNVPHCVVLYRYVRLYYFSLLFILMILQFAFLFSFVKLTGF